MSHELANDVLCWPRKHESGRVKGGNGGGAPPRPRPMRGANDRYRTEKVIAAGFGVALVQLVTVDGRPPPLLARAPRTPPQHIASFLAGCERFLLRCRAIPVRGFGADSQRSIDWSTYDRCCHFKLAEDSGVSAINMISKSPRKIPIFSKVPGKIPRYVRIWNWRSSNSIKKPSNLINNRSSWRETLKFRENSGNIWIFRGFRKIAIVPTSGINSAKWQHCLWWCRRHFIKCRGRYIVQIWTVHEIS